MHEVKSELMNYCNSSGSKELVSLVKNQGCGFSVKAQESKHLWIMYEDMYIAFNWDWKPGVSFTTSGDNNTSDSKRFGQDEKLFTRLLSDLKKLKA